MISLLLAIRTESEANLHEHRMKKAARTKLQRSIIKNRIGQVRKDFGLWDSNQAYIVTLTRVAPRPLDTTTCRDPSRPSATESPTPSGSTTAPKSKLTWKYAQEKGPPKQYAVGSESKSSSGKEADVLESTPDR